MGLIIHLEKIILTYDDDLQDVPLAHPCEYADPGFPTGKKVVERQGGNHLVESC
jgi:hypothetical protein